MSRLKDTVEDAEDHEIFDINDFTTASDWERFIVQIEDLINQWKLNLDKPDTENIDFENGEWSQKSETIVISDELTFTINFYSLCSKEETKNENKPLTKSEKFINTEKTYEETILTDFDSYSLASNSLNPSNSLFEQQTEEIDKYSQTSLKSFNTNVISLPPKSMADLLNKTNDFKISNLNQLTSTPSIAYWYGLCKFLVLTPTRQTNFIESESKARMILSSIAIAINNTSCQIPMFVQVHSSHREMFMGLCEGSALKTHFQVAHFNYIPLQYSHLSGLLEIFKSKLGNHLSASSLFITVSIRFTYLIQENTFIDWQQSNPHKQKQILSSVNQKKESFDLDMFEDNDFYPNIKNLPFGAFQDCIDSIYLSCVWSNMSEDVITENESFSDLNPLLSNEWSICLNNVCEKCDLQLTNLLSKFIEELKRTISVNQILGSNVHQSSKTMQNTELNPSSSSLSLNEELKKSSLKKLTGSRTQNKQIDLVYNLSSNMMEKATDKMKIININDTSNLPLDKGFLDFIMDYLFPDANLSPKSNQKNSNEKKASLENKSFQAFLKKLNLMKSSSSDNCGLLNKLAICLAIVNEIGQTKAIAQLWKEFLLEIRYRYESSYLIPDLNEKKNTPVLKSSTTQEPNSLIPPDLSRCLLHQKLQMINCCIKKKLDRQVYELNNNSNMDALNKQSEKNKSDSDESEDQFFDCEDESVLNMSKEEGDKGTQSPKQQANPEGRLKKYGQMTLLKNQAEPLYVPVTQESTPMTEDMLEQHASVLVNLGNSDDASLLRAKIQSASLLSDMQAFKAANPNCIIEDFVRWYSPRDWIETEEKIIDTETNEEKIVKKYDLSNRMKIPGNMWIEVWSNANPVPVRRQKRLFDDTKEAENVFEFLNNLTIGQIIEQLLPILFYSAIFRSYSEAITVELQSFLESNFEILIDKAIKISRINETNKYKDLIGYIKTIEQLISLMKSIYSKFSYKNSLLKQKNEKEVKNFLQNLLISSMTSENFELKIENGAHSEIGKLITKICKRKSKLKANKKQNNYELINESNENDQETDEDDEENESEEDEETQQRSPFDNLFKREYILRASTSRPAPYSRQSPQRMYCLLSNHEFRLASAFTEDTMFF